MVLCLGSTILTFTRRVDGKVFDLITCQWTNVDGVMELLLYEMWSVEWNTFYELQ